jgi:hypothetical protein
VKLQVVGSNPAAAFIFQVRSLKDENGKEGMDRDFYFGNVGNRPLRSKRAVDR